MPTDSDRSEQHLPRRGRLPPTMTGSVVGAGGFFLFLENLPLRPVSSRDSVVGWGIRGDELLLSLFLSLSLSTNKKKVRFLSLFSSVFCLPIFLNEIKKNATV
jgi:hypothetical protein